MSVKSIILAAGKGTRMKSDTPKVLHKIFGVPLLGYVIDALEGLADENFVIVGHQAETVTEYVNKEFSNVKTVLQSPQLGTGHAVSMACPQLENFDGEVLILCGDTPLITNDTLKEFIDFHCENNSDLTVMSAMFENPTNYGRIIREENGTLSSIVEEKDATQEQKQVKEVNAGIYCLDWQKVKASFADLKSNNAQGEYYLTDIISWGKSKNLNVNAYTLRNNEEIFGINSKIHLAEATKILNEKTLLKLMEDGVTVVDPKTAWISPKTTIESDTIIYPNVYITGENKIGSHCSIGPFAHIRGGAEIGNNVRIGNFVEIKNSTIKNNTNVSHLSYIGDSDLGSGVNIGAGTITANYDPVNKVKSRTVIENNANTGSNSVLVAPVTLKEGALLAAGSVLTKTAPAKSLVLTRPATKVIENWVK